MERSLVLLKPDTVKRQIVGEIVTRFEKVGLRIVGMKMLYPDRGHYHKHYEDISQMISRRGEKAFDVTLEFMQKGPVIALVLEGVHAVGLVRKMVGDTEPSKSLPGTIRGDYAHISIAHANARGAGIANLIHASGNVEEAKAEVGLWFKPAELFDYDTAHREFTH
jgi:nucleoside-diphosphate kinase